MIFKCKCGTIRAELLGTATKLDMNCHCHSCVASAKLVESKPSWDGYSALTVGGFAYSLVTGGNLNFSTELLTDNAHESLLGFVKVGESGKMCRAYCKSCGTVLGAFEKNFAFLNRNAIFNDDGTPYTSLNPVINIMKKHAFEPAKVQEPSVNVFPIRNIPGFIPIMLGFGGKVAPKESCLYPKDPSKVEVVPITWE